MLERGYPIAASLKLVGDRHRLRSRQRLAVSRAACPESRCRERASRCRSLESLSDREILIDGFNLLITIEAALSGGVLLRCRDECLRDLSSVHGSYRAVQETEQALDLIGRFLEPLAPRAVTWLLDRPVSNSGRLARSITALAAQRAWPWGVEVVFNPDTELRASGRLVVSTDSAVLDGAACWANVAAHLVDAHLLESWVVDLRSQA